MTDDFETVRGALERAHGGPSETLRSINDHSIFALDRSEAELERLQVNWSGAEKLLQAEMAETARLREALEEISAGGPPLYALTATDVPTTTIEDVRAEYSMVLDWILDTARAAIKDTA